MPVRLLREGILDSESVCKLSFPAEVFYRRLMSAVDDFGRFDGRASVLRSRLYPVQIDKVREADISRWVAECETAGLIALYAVEARPYILFHKTDPPRSAKSKYPAPSFAPLPRLQTSESSCAQTQTSESSCAQVLSDVPYSYSGSDSYSVSDSGSESSVSSEPDKAPASEPAPPEVLLTFSTVGKDGDRWHLTADQVAKWQALFPTIDVMSECRKALAWCEANPTNRKTFRGMPAMLARWLTKATDSGRGRSPAAVPPPRPAGETPAERTRRILAAMNVENAAKGRPLI